MTAEPYEQLLDIARRVALAAGERARTLREIGVEVAAAKSSIVDVVTEADRQTEALIRELLAAERPDDGFYGEETDAHVGASGLTWVVDPIDGTVNYLYGIPQYAVSIALVEGEPTPGTWRALAGAVYNPAQEELFTATTGGGARLGSRALQVNPSVPLGEALVATGFSYSAEGRARQGRLIAALLPEVRDVRRMGAAALDLCAVACGRLDAYFERGLQPWDHAAGALIAAEAGARVSGWDGAPATADLLLAAPPELAAALETKLKESADPKIGLGH